MRSYVVTIRIPECVEVRLVLSRGLGAISGPGEFSRDDDVCTSAGYAGSANRVDIRIDNGVGAVDVVRLR